MIFLSLLLRRGFNLSFFCSHLGAIRDEILKLKEIDSPDLDYELIIKDFKEIEYLAKKSNKLYKE